jgi:hypothetical protein
VTIAGKTRGAAGVIVALASGLGCNSIIGLEAGQPRCDDPLQAHWDPRLPKQYESDDGSTVVDQVTGLRWERTARGPTTFAAANSSCPPGWRLPTRIELVSLLDYTRSIAIDERTFPRAESDSQVLWTSSAPARELDGVTDPYVLVVDPVTGDVDALTTPTETRVSRCVRLEIKSEIPCGERYEDRDGAVLDRETGLTWTRELPLRSVASSWEGALLSCTGGFRLPTVAELQTLMNETPRGNDPIIDLGHFPDTPSADYFWTSSERVGETDKAWVASFYFGKILPYPKTGLTEPPEGILTSARCVR